MDYKDTTRQYIARLTGKGDIMIIGIILWIIMIPMMVMHVREKLKTHPQYSLGQWIYHIFGVFAFGFMLTMIVMGVGFLLSFPPSFITLSMYITAAFVGWNFPQYPKTPKYPEKIGENDG
jgi:hypothetical protein